MASAPLEQRGMPPTKCPTQEELARFIGDELDVDSELGVCIHIIEGCARCQGVIDAARMRSQNTGRYLSDAPPGRGEQD